MQFSVLQSPFLKHICITCNSFERYLVAVCPNNGGLLLDEAQQPKLCMDNIECQGSGKGAYFCNNGYCCPESGKCIDQLVLIALSPLL